MNKVSMLRGYGVAVIACGIALLIARPLKAESSCFVLAVIVSSLFGGRGPGLLAVGLSAIAFDVFFLPPSSLYRAPRHPICASACFSWWRWPRAN
jgi:K+-sensing histidine kinase KdpD